MDYRDKLKKARIAARLTQGELTELANLNGSQAIKHAELKNQHLSVPQLEAISKVLKVPLCRILDGYPCGCQK